MRFSPNWREEAKKENEIRAAVSASPDPYPNFEELEESLAKAKIAGEKQFEIVNLTQGEVDFCRVAGYLVGLNDSKDAFVVSWGDAAPRYCFR